MTQHFPSQVTYSSIKLFFIHSSRNDSDFRRWVYVIGYNKRKNNPLKEHHVAMYHPLKMLPNSALKECNLFDSTEDKCYMDPNKDSSAASLKKSDENK